ncbi:MAG: alpha/beta fold hydrolase [Dehalococcoidia bacterium]|jgi:pimeloyl-ACP methyl ester carboxylesterase
MTIGSGLPRTTLPLSRLMPTRVAGASFADDVIQYLIRAEFGTDYGAPLPSAVAAEIGGLLAIVDTESKLSVVNGLASFSGGKTVAGFLDPAIWTPSVRRTAGRVILWKVRPTSAAQAFQVGIDGNQAPTVYLKAFTFRATGQLRVDPAPSPDLYSYSANTDYILAMVLANSGAFYLLYNGGEWHLLYDDTADSTAVVHPFVGSVSAVVKCDYIRVPTDPLTISPVAVLGAFGLTNANTPDVLTRANLTRVAGTIDVICRYVDPDNYVYARLLNDGANKVTLRKVLASSDSEVLAPMAVTYAAAAPLRLHCEGTKFRVFYNDLAVGTEQTISDVALQAGTTVGVQTDDGSNAVTAGITYARKGYTDLNRFFDSSPAVVGGSITYPSSIDALLLAADVAYPSGLNLPILVVMHGYTGLTSDFTIDMRRRWCTSYGHIFCIFPQMRGRGSSEGARDSGGREIQDIVDAVDYVIAHYGTRVDPTQVHIVGYSGGGGNALSCAARSPDRFNSVVSFFGISDYGYDGTDGWYQNVAAFQVQLATDIGGTPATVPDSYHSRASVLAVTNYLGGQLYLFHDALDATVNVAQSRRVAAEMMAAGLTNCTYRESTTGASPRWYHGLPVVGASLIEGETDFMPAIGSKARVAWIVPASGTLTVAGWLDTKRFSLWLGDSLAEFGAVTYDLTTLTFTITVDTGAFIYTLKVKGQTPGANVTATINTVELTEEVDANGIATFAG